MSKGLSKASIGHVQGGKQRGQAKRGGQRGMDSCKPRGQVKAGTKEAKDGVDGCKPRG